MSATQENMIEAIRKKVVSDLLALKSLKTVWPVWVPEMRKSLSGDSLSSTDLIAIGNSFYDVFTSTAPEEDEDPRGQSELSIAGTAWEGLVCWYLNLCLLETQCVVIKKKSMIPTPISDALTVLHGSVASNTESDLIAITFPKEVSDYRIEVTPAGTLTKYKENLANICTELFDQIEVCVIQCKTTWNDEAQKPMLWDLIYSSLGFSTTASVGRNGWSVKNLRRFAYSFATVPSQKKEFRSDLLPVLRVKNISGGNFWARPTQRDVALNVSEMLNKNFLTAITGCEGGWNKKQTELYKNLSEDYPYFKFP